MKLTRVFIHFTGLFFLFKILFAVTFAVLDFKSNSSGVIVSLLFATRMSCDAFSKKHGVFFSKTEARKVVFGFALINMISAAAGSYLILVEASIPITPVLILAFFIEAGLLHTACIYFIVRLTGNRFKKNLFMKAYNNQSQIYSTSVLSEAHIVKDIIESHGIPCDLRTENKSSRNMGGEIPLVTNSSLWISDKSKCDEARRLVEEYESTTSQDASSEGALPWTCPSCGEESEGQFTSCWSCGGLKAAR